MQVGGRNMIPLFALSRFTVSLFMLLQRFNSAAVAEVLLHSGANPSFVDALDSNALHHAVRRSSRGVVNILLRDSDIDVNARTQVGMTALHLVCMSGDLEICSNLLRHGADITAKTVDYSTPLHTAIFSCNTQLAELLIKEGKLRCKQVFSQSLKQSLY